MRSHQRSLAARFVGALASRERPVLNPQTFSDDFEDQTLDAWPTSDGNIVANMPLNGVGGAEFSPTAGTGAHLATSTTKWDQDHPWGSLSFNFAVLNSTPAESVEICTIRNGNGVNHFDFFVGAGGEWEADLVGSQGITGAAADSNTHQLQVKVHFGTTTYRAWVRLDGVLLGTITDTGQVASFVRSLHFGTTATDKEYVIDVDDVQLVVADSDPGWVG